jgi:hypothetical protein
VTYVQAFRHAAMRAMLALIAWSLLLATVFTLGGHLTGRFSPAIRDTAWLILGVSLVVGYLFLLAFAVPIYTLISRRGRVGPLHVFAIAVVPGAVAYAFLDIFSVGLLFVSGLFVLFTMHLLLLKDWSQGAGPNKSAERTRER